MDTQENIIAQFECIVCKEPATPPIRERMSSHLICNECFAKVSKSRKENCPFCRGPLRQQRNLAMEKIAMFVKFPCQFNINDCPQTLMLNEKADHEKHCLYKPFHCPLPGSCKWFDGSDMIHNHINNAHNSVMMISNESAIVILKSTDINTRKNAWVIVQSCFNQKFLIILEVKYNKFYVFAQMLTRLVDHKSYFYKVTLSANMNEISWVSTMRSIDQKRKDIINNHECFAIDIYQLDLFYTNNNLAVVLNLSSK